MLRKLPVPQAETGETEQLKRIRKRVKERVVDLEEQCMLLVDSYIALPQAEREYFLRKINLRAMEWRKFKPDDELDHLAKPGSEAAKRHAAKIAKTYNN